jgi:uncharacterized protein
MKTADMPQLAPHDAQIFKQFAESVRQHFPDARIWAFGSRVKGTATQESDLDVCVVLSTLSRATDHEIMDVAWHIGFDHEVVISTVTYSTEEFEHGPCSQSSLVHNILTQGVSA